MEQFISSVQWSQFLNTAAWLVLGYVLIRNLPTLRRIITGRESRNLRMIRIGSSLRVGYELVAAVILTVLYLRINVITHSIVLAVVIFVTWVPLRNLLNGRFLWLTTSLKKGQKIAFNGEEAIVRSVAPLALVLQTNEGTQIVDYTHLREHGLTLISGNQLSNFLELRISPNEKGKVARTPLDQLLLTCPYLDWSYRPEISTHEFPNLGYELKVLLIDEKYRRGFIALIKEWGYSVALPSSN